MDKSTCKNKYEILAFSRSDYGPRTEICRYLTFEKFAWLLEKSLLYHCRLDQFQDPFEGAITKPYAQKRYSEEPLRHPLGPDFEALNNWRLRCSSFATCWYASSVRSDAMWKLYSNEKAGVAIVSTPHRLSEAVGTLPKGYWGFLGPIEYLDFQQDDMKLKNGLIVKPGLAKPKSFSHEKEVRGLLHPNGANISDEIMKNPDLLKNREAIQRHTAALPKGLNVPVNLGILIQNIVISPLAPHWFGELARIQAERRGLADVIQLPEQIEPIF